MKKKSILVIELLALCAIVLMLTACPPPSQASELTYDQNKADWITQFAGTWELDAPKQENQKTFFKLECRYEKVGHYQNCNVDGRSIRYERQQSDYGEYDYVDNYFRNFDMSIFSGFWDSEILYYEDPLPEQIGEWWSYYLSFFPEIEVGTTLVGMKYPATLSLSDDKSSLTITMYEVIDDWFYGPQPQIVNYTFHRIHAIPAPIPMPLPPETPPNPGDAGGEPGDPSIFAGTYKYTTGTPNTNGTLTLNANGTWSYAGNKGAFNGNTGTFTVSGNTITITDTATGYTVTESYRVTESGNSVTWTPVDSTEIAFIGGYFGCVSDITFTKE